MMLRVALVALLACTVAVSAHAAKPSYWCAVMPDPASSPPGVVSLHVTGTVPQKAIPYLRIDGSQEWTALDNQHGVIDNWTGRTTAELPAGTTHTAELLDYRASPVDAVVIATCTFTT